MTDTDTPGPDEFEAEQALWDIHQRIMLAKGFDFNNTFAQWAAKEGERLNSDEARRDFHELCEAGCVPQVLAAIVELIRFSPRLNGLWTQMLGSSYRRQKASKALQRAAGMLEASFAPLEDEDAREKMHDLGRIPPSRLVSELRSYVGLLNLAESLAADTEAHSVSEVLRYTLTSYVRRVTGRFYDRSISSLLGDSLGHMDYYEVAQRMWRHRNYSRLEKHFLKLTDFLLAMGVVISRST